MQSRMVREYVRPAQTSARIREPRLVRSLAVSAPALVSALICGLPLAGHARGVSPCLPVLLPHIYVMLTILSGADLRVSYSSQRGCCVASCAAAM